MSPGSSPLYRNGLALALNSGLTSIVGIVYWAVAARLTTPRVLGLNSALISAVIAIAGIAQLGLGGTLATFLPRQQNGSSRGRMILKSYVVTATVGALLALGFVAVAREFSPALRALHGTVLTLSFCASAAMWTIFALQDNVLTGLRRAVWVPLENGIYSAVKLAALAVLIGLLPSYGILVSWMTPAALAVIPVSVAIFLIFLRSPTPGPAPARPAVARMSITRYAPREALGTVALQLSTTLLPVLVVSRLGAAEGARFFIPWTIALALDLAAVGVGMALTVEGAHGYQGSPMMRRLVQWVPILVGCVAGLAALAAPVILALFGRQYTGVSTNVLRLLMLGSVIRSLNTLRIARWRAELRASWVASSQVLMALITPALAWVLMGQIGILGAGVAWVVGQGVVASIGSVAGRQRTSSGAPGRDSGTPEVLRADPALGL